MAESKLENCDYCNKISTHERSDQKGRKKYCCEHHIEHGGEAYILHDQCILYGAKLAKVDSNEFKARLANKAKQSTIFS